MTARLARAPLPFPEPTSERLLTLKEAAARLRTSERQVRRLTYRPTRPIPVVMLGERAVRIREAALDRWIRENEGPAS